MTGKRRGNGEGSVYRLPDGRWRGSVFLGYREGKPHRKYVTRRTRAEVAAEIRRLIEVQRQGQLVTTGGMTVGSGSERTWSKLPGPRSARGPWTATALISSGTLFRQSAGTGSTSCGPRLLRVRRGLQRQRGGGLVFTEPKTDRSKRTLPLPAPLAAALIEHRTRQDKERLTAGSLWQGSPCVFTTPIGPRNDFREFRKLLARAGLPPVRLHDLRHTAASLLLAQNVPARVVMEILGHSQIALTMNTYSHVAPEISHEAADRMARMLWQDDTEAEVSPEEDDQRLALLLALLL
jgi:Phage integrase family